MRFQLIQHQNFLLALTLGGLLSLSACSSSPEKPIVHTIEPASTSESEDTAEVVSTSAISEQEEPSEPVIITQATEADDTPYYSDASVDETSPTHTAAVASIRTDHPQQYIVQRGDTLWGISGKFLDDPWYWPELWYKNPQIENPHLIYPGDIISLIYVDGQPRIQISRPGEEGAVVTHGVTAAELPTEAEPSTFERLHEDGALKQVKLSPTIRRSSLEASIPTIPNDAIEQFTTNPQVVTLAQWENAPYILGSDDKHLVLSAGNRIYVRGELDKEKLRYTIYRRGDRLKDPRNGELIGYEVVYAGEASIITYDDPATGRIIKANREIIIGDRLLPTDKSDINNIYFPKPPETDVEGQVVSLFDAISSIAQYQVAVVNLGTRDGLDVGNILATYSQGDTVRDRFQKADGQLRVKLPNERSGLMMLFKTFDRVSYGLILESTGVIHRLDVVRTPYR